MSLDAVAAKHASLQIAGFEKRRKYGKLGKNVKIMTNFFEITRLPQMIIMQYVLHLPPLSFLTFSIRFR